MKLVGPGWTTHFPIFDLGTDRSRKWINMQLHTSKYKSKRRRRLKALTLPRLRMQITSLNTFFFHKLVFIDATLWS